MKKAVYEAPKAEIAVFLCDTVLTSKTDPYVEDGYEPW